MIWRYLLACLLFSAAACAAENDMVEILFVPLGKGPSAFPDDGKAQKRELVDGKAEFVSLSQLPKSEYYVGYQLTVGTPVVGESGRQGLSLTLWAADFKGFLSLEDEKLTPLISAGVETFLMDRYSRNRGWVIFQLSEPIAPRPMMSMMYSMILASEEGEPEQWKSVEAPGDQTGVMLFVRWSGPVEEDEAELENAPRRRRVRFMQQSSSSVPPLPEQFRHPNRPQRAVQAAPSPEATQ